MDKSPEAVAAILESLQPRILSQFGSRIERLIGARSGGPDLYQEVAYKVFKSLPKFRGTTQDELAGWIMTIAGTTANRLLSANLKFANRSQKREAFRIDRTDWAAELNDEELARVEVREEAEYVIEKMAALSPRRREAVSLYYLSGMSYPQICERMNCSNDAARQLVSHGLADIRKYLAEAQTQAAAS